MKSIYLILSAFIISYSLCAQGAGTINLLPEHPMPGEKIMINYLPGKSSLDEAENVYGLAYCLGGEDRVVLDITLKEKEGQFSGELTIPEDAKLISFLFEDELGKEKDDNNKKGFHTLLYNSDRITPVKKSIFEAAAGLFVGYQGYQIDANPEKGYKKMQKELALHPELKEERDFVSFYSYAAHNQNDEKGIAEIKNVAAKWAKAKKSEEKLQAAYFLYTYDLKVSEEADKLKKTLLKKYPRGKFAKSQARKAVFDAKDDPSLMVNKFAEMQAIYNLEEKSDKDSYLRTSVTVAETLFENKEIEKAKTFLSKIDTEHALFAGACKSAADILAGKTLEGAAIDLELAMNYAKQADQAHQNLLNSPGEIPSYRSERQHLRSLKKSTGSYKHTLALIHYKMGNHQKALSKQEKALSIVSEPNLEWYEAHAIYYEAVHGPEAAEKLLATYVQKNQATEKMKAQFKKIFLANNSPERAFDKYLALLEKEANKEYRDKVKMKMIDETAPDFTLVNLDGEKIKLEEMKGKVVVLDFWATWCSPCIKSFPGMQEAQNRLEDNEKVVFLFIDSWQSEPTNEEKEKVVRELLEKKKYNFNVLMDYDDSVIKSYKVQGIPTKFVIGPDGHIRFKSVGFPGSEEGMIKELMMMIELASERDLATASMGS